MDCQSGAIEQSFGLCWQMSGSKYLINVKQASEMKAKTKDPFFLKTLGYFAELNFSIADKDDSSKDTNLFSSFVDVF